MESWFKLHVAGIQDNQGFEKSEGKLHCRSEIGILLYMLKLKMNLGQNGCK